MFRIDHPTNTAIFPTPSPAGTPGYFTKGNPTLLVPATRVTQDWANAVQEELANVVEGGGLVLDKGARDQVLQAILRLTDSSGLSNLAINGLLRIQQRQGLAGFTTSADSTEKFLQYDRWQFKAGGGAETATVTGSSINSLVEETPSRVNRYLDFDKPAPGVSGVFPTIATRLEDVIAYGGRPVVFAFDAKKISGANFTLDGAEAVQDFGAAGSADVATELAPLSSELVDSNWRRYSYGANLPATLGKTINFGHHVTFRLRLPANTVLRFGITAFTIQRATRDVGFIERPDWLERFLCCRYLETHGPTWSSANEFLHALWNTNLDFDASGAVRTMGRLFRVEKRGIPNMIWYNAAGTANAITEASATSHPVTAFQASPEHTGHPSITAPPGAGDRLFRARFLADVELV
jgi:hypothetical protein